MDRLFADTLLGHKNVRQQLWNGSSLDPVKLLEFAAPWSSGERHLALLAAELWGYTFPEGEARFNILDAACALPAKHMTTVLEAIALRAGMTISLTVIVDPVEALMEQYGEYLRTRQELG